VGNDFFPLIPHFSQSADVTTFGLFLDPLFLDPLFLDPLSSGPVVEWEALG
jgi:hypothetical protein